VLTDATHPIAGGGNIRSAIYSRLLSTADVTISATPSPSIASMRSRRQPFGMIP